MHFLIIKKRPLFSQRAIDSRYHLYYIEETPLYISSYSLTGTTPGPPTVTSAFLLQSYLLHLCSQVPRSQWASLSVRTTYAYSSFSTHLTGLSTMKLQNIIATEVLFVKVFREFSENLKRPHQKGISKAEWFSVDILCNRFYYYLLYNYFIVRHLSLLRHKLSV